MFLYITTPMLGRPGINKPSSSLYPYGGGPPNQPPSFTRFNFPNLNRLMKVWISFDLISINFIKLN